MADTVRSRARLFEAVRTLQPPTPHQIEVARIAAEGRRERQLRETEWGRVRTPWLADDGEDGATLT
jgi:hypothetical protein